MDSITQAVLGIAVADIGLGRQIGRKAAWWGLALGTLPDLDILAYLWLDPVEQLNWHRGISHSLLAMLVTAPLITWMWRAIHGPVISWRRGMIVAFLIWATHVAVDMATVYGTMVWEPFSSRPEAWNLLFIIDPLYTTPLFITALAALAWPLARIPHQTTTAKTYHTASPALPSVFASSHRIAMLRGSSVTKRWADSTLRLFATLFGKGSGLARWRWRQQLAWVGLGLSSAYFGWAIIAKTVTKHHITADLAAAGIPTGRLMTAATVGNTILWRAVAETTVDGQAGFVIAYSSLFDDDRPLRWRFVPSQHELLDRLPNERAIRTLQRFSSGWLVVRDTSEGLLVSDLRFGEVTAAAADIEAVERPWIFNFLITADGTSFARRAATWEGAEFGSLFARIWGDRTDDPPP